MRSWLILVSDLHINSTLGLCPPEGIDLDDGGRYLPSLAQQWLYECWQQMLLRVRERWRPGDRIFGIVNGDGPDLNPRTTQLITLNPSSIIAATVSILKPLRELCTDGFWIVRGTEAHSGGSGSLEETIARILQATKYPADSERSSCWLLRIRLSGVSIDVTHHGPFGRLPWTSISALGRVAYEIIDEYIAAGMPLPQVAVQAHNHRYGDTGNNFPIRIIALPCWQLQTAYGVRISPRRRTQIGGVLALCENGRFDAEPILFFPQMEQRWESS